MNIEDKLFVSIDYILTLESGEEVDRSPEGEPLGFIMGSGQMIPGLEKGLMGSAKGDRTKITVDPEDAYGTVREEMFQEIPRSQFPDDAKVEPGMTFQAHGPQGPIMINVMEVNDNDVVKVDLNHPLAGKKLFFDINVVDVRQPTSDELAQLSAAGCGCGSEQQASCGCGTESQGGGCGSGGCNCG
ncbi:MAG: peptidylprolyl isomerase [Desulfobulbaceae bacterium]|nr:peptidylprolyl isomerase [Desulfobulbaceae bacterium]